MAGLATSGTLTHWFRDQFARDLGDAAFGLLVTEAEASPKGAKGLLCLPYFSGERTPIHDPQAVGAFFGLNLTHGRGDMFRAVLEGIASGTAHVMETCRDLGTVPSRVLAVGGGTKNAVWMQATSDFGGVPQIVAEKTIGASYGNAFLAAVAVGAATPADITLWNPVARVVQPQAVPAYARQYPLFKRLYAQTRDIAHELAWPLPFDVFFNLLGLPSVHDDKFSQLEKWTHQLKHREPNSPELTPISKAAAENIRNYFKELIEDRRKKPSDDLLTHIVNAEIEGKPFVEGEVTEDSEVLGLLTLLFLGGVESTAGLIGSVFKLLAENPDQRALVLADPSRVSDAIEETLRWSSPLQETARTAIRDVELHGTTIPAGSRVVLVTGAANRDDRQFENPDKFDISRGKFRHFGFGEGLHRCLGAPLARLEASIVLEEVLPLLGEYELSQPATFYPSSPNMYVWKNVPIRFNVA